MTTINELKWSTLTATINEIKPNADFLQNLLFRRFKTLGTETIEIGFKTGGRIAAPFVKVNGEALLVSGRGEKFATVKAPNIRIKRNMEASDLLFTRRPGTIIFPTPGQQMTAIQEKIAEEQENLLDLITNAKEWMCAMAIRGTITYEVEDEEVYTITYPKPAGHTVTVSPYWDDNVSPASSPMTDFRTVKRLISEEVGLNPTHCIMGQLAADAFMRNEEVKTYLDTRNYRVGNLTMEEMYNDSGVIYLGRFCGIPCFEYPRTVELNGTAVNLIRTNYAEFVSASSGAENIMYYGAIPDMKALQGRKFKGKIFSKSWEEEDPSARLILAHSRPLPVPRRPGSMVSLKVVADP